MVIDSLWPLCSRVHSLNHFPSNGLRVYIKRDDELGCGISGTKLRKYASLIPYLKAQRIEHLVVIASPQSNNLLAILQLAREFQFQLTLFLLKPRHEQVQGNFKLSQLFMDPSEVIWVDRSEWPEVETKARSYAASLDCSSFVLPEGASVPQALPGAMTLAADICRNEKELGVVFDHVFVDAGTGFSAAALIKAMSDLQHRAVIHVLLLADTEAVFRSKLQAWIGQEMSNYRCYLPSTAKSFGTFNATIAKEIRRMAREEGVLTEPIYSAKLCHEARILLSSQAVHGNVLLIHSGGLLTLSGFNTL